MYCMKRYLLSFFIALSSLLMCFCSSKQTETTFNEHVSGFTSGNISRKASVYLILSEDIDASRIEKINLQKCMSISPSAKGTFSFADAHTIVFNPTEDMAYNTTYKITAELDDIFDDDSKDFSFEFKTYPFHLNASFEKFSESNDENYVYEISIRTLDEESLDVVQSVICYTEGLQSPKVEWIEKDSRNYTMILSFKPTKEQELTISTKKNKDLDLEEELLLAKEIPDPNKLSVFDVTFVENDTKYIQVTFNKNLDTKQNKRGLAYIVGNESQSIECEGNVIKLFPDRTKEGVVSVFLSQNIRSTKGLILGKDVVKEIELIITKPKIEFVDEGNIFPQSDKFVVPFRSIYMRGVKVRVFKIYNNNIASLLQRESINSCYNLKLLGRPVAVTTFFLDETLDFKKWNVCAIDLSDLVKTEPGCMYRVELLMDYRLSAWPGAEQTINKQDFEAEDKVEMAKLNDSFDDDNNWYYIDSDFDWMNYSYDDRDNPSTKSFYIERSVGKNVLSTNIGLLALAPTAHNLTVIATNLLTAKAMKDVEVSVYNRQAQVIAKGTTDGDGRIDFELTGNMGAPYFTIARKDSDVSGMRVKRGEELSTSTFDVSGQTIQKGLKGYMYGERGVWRPGDTIFLSFMLNDREKTLPENHPVVMEMTNPLGQSYCKMTKTSGICGVYSFAIPTSESDPTGSWLATIQVGGTSFSKRLRVETVKPNRLKIDLQLPKMLVSGNQSLPLHTEWLTGGATHNLKYTIAASFVKTQTSFDKWKEYVFEDPSSEFESGEYEVARSVTNEIGDASVHLDVPEMTQAPGKLRCRLTTQVYEESGEFSTDVQYVDYSPFSHYVGLKAPKSEKEYIPTGSNQTFSIVSVDANGNAVSGMPLLVEVYKVEWWWWWNCSSYQLADYTTSSYNEPFMKDTKRTDANGLATFSMNVKDSQWGTYFIRVTDQQSKHKTGLLAYFDWPSLSSPRSIDGRESAFSLSIKTDKDEYVSNEAISAIIPSTEGSRAIVSLCNSTGIIDMKFIECHGTQTTVNFKATDEMIPNAYICATVIQPYNHTENNDVPIRLYGVKSITINSQQSHLNPIIESANETRPMEQYKVVVGEKDGREMAYTLAIVDEGLLDLTRFKTPNAWNEFNAKEALGMRMWDLYNLVSGAYGGRIDQMFSIGGDECLYDGPKAVVNRFTPMVYFKGPFKLAKGKKNTHTIDVPNYNGRVRVMVVAGDGSAYGSAEKSVFVRKPLMVTGTMPRQIGVNDEMTVSATIFVTDKNIKDVTTTISCSNNLQIVGNKSITTSFSSVGDKTVQFAVKAGAKDGIGKISIKSTSSADEYSYDVEIPIRSVSQQIKMVETSVVDAGGTFSKKVFAQGSSQQKISVEISNIQPLNASNRIAELIEYPHGCAEQITSKALSQLYLKEFADLTEAQKKEADEHVKIVLQKLMNYQTNDGGISYWPHSSFANSWASAYVLMFLEKASEKGYFVTESMKKNLKKYVTNQVKNWKSNTNAYDSQTIAFSLYVLALNNSPERSTMNRMKEASAQLTDMTSSWLAASYALIGQQNIAKSLFKNSSIGWGYGYWHSPEVINLIVESLIQDANAKNTAETVRKHLASNEWLSTSETAIGFHAMSTYFKKNGVSKELNFVVKTNNKEFAKISSNSMSWNSILAENVPSIDLNVANKGKGTMYVTTTTQGIATQEPIAAVNSGIEVLMWYPTDISEIQQGKIITAVCTVKNNTRVSLKNIAVTHILPAGFEVISVSPAGFEVPSAERSGYVDYQDIRDDRILSYIDELAPNRSAVIKVTLSATYAGKYYVPSVSAEQMYSKEFFGCTASGNCVIK